MDRLYQYSRRWLTCSIAVLSACAGAVFGALELPDQLDVSIAELDGLGRIAASFEDILDEVGYVVDDTFDGEIIFKWTMKWDSIVGGSAAESWATFHFYNDSNDALTGIGNAWYLSQISTFNEAGRGQDINSQQSGMEVVTGKEYAFILKVDYNAGAPDTAVLNGGGFVDHALAVGDWGFHLIRVRAGRRGNQVDFFDMSITSRGVGGISGEESNNETVAPRFPSDIRARQEPQRKDWSRWPWARIRQLETERDRLREKILELPHHDPFVFSDHLGYHSLFTDPGNEDLPLESQIDIELSWSPRLGSIALAPAFAPPQNETYGFPSRFRIEVLNAKVGKFETVVDWMDEDFPDPGPYPVFFAGINRYAKHVRITVPHELRESGQAYFALGEIYLFQQKENGQIGDNMATWGSNLVQVCASSALLRPPMWNPQYLTDGEDGFGFPLSDESVGTDDLIIRNTESSQLQDDVQLLLDMGHVKNISRVDFWPAEAFQNLVLPSFGFPQQIRVELSRDPRFVDPREIEIQSVAGERNRGRVLSVISEGYPAQFIRVTLSGLEKVNGQPVLGIGEILVSENAEIFSIGCKVDEQGIPDEYKDQLPLLVDGFSRKRRILPQGEWIKGLAQRRPLDHRLARVENDLTHAQADWRQTKQRLSVWGGIAIFMSLAGGLVLERRLRKRGVSKLKKRIARDLHDDVGSILGGISFSTEQLKQVVENTKARATLNDLSLMASEACASLREVVWVIDESTIHLPSLVAKMIERVDRVLRGAGLSVETSVDCPDAVVSLTCKRHLIMFFKEAIHNCARHAQAEHVWVDFSTSGTNLQISVRDDGCGFDSSMSTEGWGLESMSERAEEMGGEMELNSQPGKGTSVKLIIPLSALSSKSDHLYRTSN